MKNVKKEHPGFKVIFGGDFNATIGKEYEQNLISGFEWVPLQTGK